MTPIAHHMTAWLRQRLPIERGASPHTCDAYAAAFQLLFTFASDKLGVAPSDIAFEQLDARLVLDFLDHIQRERGCGPRTRNARLAAIKSFMRFMEHCDPAALNQVREVLAIPAQRVTVEPVRHLDPEQVKALLDAPDPSTRAGIRDRALLHVALTGGLRVSELVGLRLDEVAFRDRYLAQDPVDKLETLEAVVPPSLRPGTFSPPDKLLASLKRS